MDPTSLLSDPSHVVPSVPKASRGVAWLRSNVVRFSEGEDHRRRRAIVEDRLAGIDPSALERAGDHVATLAAALGLPRHVSRDVREVAACYQPGRTVTSDADAAVARLVDAAGGRWDEVTANLIGILVQANDATAAMIAGSRPPVPSTVRVDPDGSSVRVPLESVPFGAGRHRCPGRLHAEALERGARTFRELHHGDEPLVLPNAWDAASAARFVDAGFAAIGTTSLGVAAASGVPDGSGKAREATIRLVAAAVPLGVPVTVDIESGWGAALAELADELSVAGVAGVNIEDGRGDVLAPAQEQAASITALKVGAPNLFVNARVDTWWLGIDHGDTIDRARRYIDAGADGVFVPGLTDRAEIERFVAAVAAPLNLLAHADIGLLRDLGVRRISMGSLLYRAAITTALRTAESVRSGDVLNADASTLTCEGIDALARHRPADPTAASTSSSS